jgi:hypothetical protein
VSGTLCFLVFAIPGSGQNPESQYIIFVMLALTSPKSGGRSFGIVRSQTQVTEFSLVLARNISDKNVTPFSLWCNLIV